MVKMMKKKMKVAMIKMMMLKKMKVAMIKKMMMLKMVMMVVVRMVMIPCHTRPLTDVTAGPHEAGRTEADPSAAVTGSVQSTLTLLAAVHPVPPHWAG